MRVGDPQEGRVDRKHGPAERSEPLAVHRGGRNHDPGDHGHPLLRLAPQEKDALPGIGHLRVRKQAVYHLLLDDHSLDGQADSSIVCEMFHEICKDYLAVWLLEAVALRMELHSVDREPGVLDRTD